MSNSKNILTGIRWHLSEQGRTQKELASFINCSQNWISSALRGEAEFSLPQFIAIAEFLHISPSELIGGYRPTPIPTRHPRGERQSCLRVTAEPGCRSIFVPSARPQECGQ